MTNFQQIDKFVSTELTTVALPATFSIVIINIKGTEIKYVPSQY